MKLIPWILTGGITLSIACAIPPPLWMNVSIILWITIGLILFSYLFDKYFSIKKKEKLNDRRS